MKKPIAAFVPVTPMKITLAVLCATFAFVAPLRADEVSVQLTNVHMCCDECVNGVRRALADVPGLTVKADEDTETVTLTAPDKTTLQTAANALVAGGYFGKSSDPDIKLTAKTGAKGEKVKSLKVEGVHLCCGECVSTVNRALETVPGVEKNTAKKNAKSFEVTGDFNDREVFEALQKSGLNGKAAN